MKKAYTRPVLLEYGRIEQLTLGTGGGVQELNSKLEPSGTCTADPNVTLYCVAKS